MSRLQPRRHDSAENQVVILVAQSINRYRYQIAFENIVKGSHLEI